jgi:hypothetical protein
LRSKQRDLQLVRAKALARTVPDIDAHAVAGIVHGQGL